MTTNKYKLNQEDKHYEFIIGKEKFKIPDTSIINYISVTYHTDAMCSIFICHEYFSKCIKINDLSIKDVSNLLCDIVSIPTIYLDNIRIDTFGNGQLLFDDINDRLRYIDIILTKYTTQ